MFNLALRAFALARAVICGILPNLVLSQPVFAEPHASLRLFPYPFTHSISFASDVDMQKPLHGAGIHRVFNEELGLTISDSLWPHGGNITSSTLFSGPDQVNRIPSGLGTIPTFALLLREWHRGNIDHFHGWQDDSAVPLRNDFASPQTLSELKTTIVLPPVTAPILGQRSQNLRLYFSSPPPSDLQVVLHESGGRAMSFGIRNVEGTVQVREGSMGWIREILIPTDDTTGEMVLKPQLIGTIDLIAPSCAGGCSAKLTRVERDHFSRRTVLSELPFLEAWNIRPALLTSHGGNSLAQNFGSGGGVLDLPRTPGTIYSDQAIVTRLEALASVETSHAYHADLLKRLGTVGIWSYFHPQSDRQFVPLNNQLGRSNLPRSSTYVGFYDVPRSKGDVIGISNREDFVRAAERVFPDLTAAERNSLYCGSACNVAQGDALPQLIAKSLQVVNKQKSIARGLFYSHFGSGAGVPEVTGTYEKPITTETYSAMRKFSNHVYNFDGKIPISKRIWSPPANTWLRYEILQAGVTGNIRTDVDGKTITITPWLDSITKRVIPDMEARARDLHGLTIYVQDPRTVRVLVSKHELTAVVRNPPDQTGQASITLVDDNTPTAIIGSVALAKRGKVIVQEGQFVDVTPHDGVQSFMRLIAGPKGRALMTFKPKRLDLWNITHIFAETRKRSALNKTSSGFFSIRLIMSGGGSVVLTERDRTPEIMEHASYWFIPADLTSNGWQTNTLDVAQLNFPRSLRPEMKDRPALPIGSVQEIHLLLEGAAPGDTLDVSNLLALRPSGNGEAPDGTKLVAGRVTSDGNSALPHTLVYARSNHGREYTAVTDSDGYYFFYAQPRGAVLAIWATNQKNSCSPLQGQEVQILKNEFELDITCPPLPKYLPKRGPREEKRHN